MTLCKHRAAGSTNSESLLRVLDNDSDELKVVKFNSKASLLTAMEIRIWDFIATMQSINAIH